MRFTWLYRFDIKPTAPRIGVIEAVFDVYLSQMQIHRSQSQVVAIPYVGIAIYQDTGAFVLMRVHLKAATNVEKLSSQLRQVKILLFYSKI